MRFKLSTNLCTTLNTTQAFREQGSGAKENGNTVQPLFSQEASKHNSALPVNSLGWIGCLWLNSGVTELWKQEIKQWQ